MLPPLGGDGDCYPLGLGKDFFWFSWSPVGGRSLSRRYSIGRYSQIPHNTYPIFQSNFDRLNWMSIFQQVFLNADDFWSREL
jgi:hypothetical protein